MQMNRSMKLSKKEWLAFALAAVLVVLVLATGVLGKQKVWTNMGMYYMDFADGKLVYDTQAGDSHGVVSKGPGFDLPAGTYRLKIRVFADGDNVVRFTTRNGAAVEPAQVTLDADRLDTELDLQVHNFAENLEFLVDFCDGTKMEFVDIRVYSPMYSDNAFTLLFLLAALMILYLLWSRRLLGAQARGALVLMALAVLYASVPSMKDNLTMVIDSDYHLARLHNLADGLAGGQFPVRCGGFTYNGYGAVTSAFYPDLFLYPFALMLNMGASVQYTVHAFQIAMNIMTAWAMYASAKRMFGDRQSAACASCLYVLSIYRITDIYVRGAFGEALAMAFLPLFILGMWEVIFGDKERWPVLALSASAILFSHILSTLMCACLAAGMCVLFIGRIIREKRLMAIVKAAGFALGICLFQLVPFLTYSMQGMGAASIRGNMDSSALAPAQLFLLSAGDMPVDPADYKLSGMPLEIGAALVLGAALALYRLLTAEEKEQGAREALLLTAAGALFAVMCTTVFPWSYISRFTLRMADYIQFPWRFLMFTTAMFAMAGGWGYVRLMGEKKDAGVVLALAVALFAVLPTIGEQTRCNDYLEFGQGASADINYSEYTLPGTKARETRDQSVLTEGEVALVAYEKDGTTITAQVKAETDAKVSFPLFGFDGYKASLGGEEIAWTLGENNRLTVDLPAGAQGEVRVWFAGKTIWRIADCVSLITAAAMAALCLRRRRTARRG